MMRGMADFPIITKLGGRDASFEAVKRRTGKPGTVDALRMWASRGSMPGFAVIACMAEANKRRISYDPSDFQLPEAAPAPAPAPRRRKAS